MLVDLRSDTVTRPTASMMQAIAGATVEDAARDRDPTVDALQSRAAAETGKEAALFVPTGTMANLAAIIGHTRPGDEIVCDPLAHVYRSERAGMAAVAGVLPVLVDTVDRVDAAPDPNMLAWLLNSRRGDRIRLICVETAHNGRGGVVASLAAFGAVRGLAAKAGVPVHLDGARVFNAAVRLDCGVSTICQYADSVTFCLSKGLGAPVGSVLCGDKPFIDRAAETIKRLGGAMRQSGLMAAAGLAALDEGPARLAEDHGIARMLAETLFALDPGLVDLETVQTNIVNIDPRPMGGCDGTFVAALTKQGVLIDRRDDGTIRLVTHHHVRAPEADFAAQALIAAWRELAGAPASGLEGIQ